MLQSCSRIFQLILSLTAPYLSLQNLRSTEGNLGVVRASSRTGVFYISFAIHKHQYLQGTMSDVSLEVDRPSECTLACLNNQVCFSFNLALQPSGNQKLRCELLSGDKYRSPSKLVVSQSFHHYSIKVDSIYHHYNFKKQPLDYHCD